MIHWSTLPLSVEKRLLELDARSYTQERMGEILHYEYPEYFTDQPNRNQVKNALAEARAKAKQLQHKLIPERTPYYTKYRDIIEGDVIVEKNDALFKQVLEKSKRKILVLSDIHVPFTDEEKLQQAINLHRSADLLVIAGDTMDSYALSRWRKTDNIPFDVELDMTVRLIEYLSEIFPAIIIIPGNHDQRATKKVQDSLPPELLFLFEGNPISLLTKPFSNVKFHDHWWVQIGDAIIGHPERSSTIDGRPAVMFSEYIIGKGWAHRLKLDPYPRLFVSAHTHQVSEMYRENLKMFESGCLASVMEYSLDSKVPMRPPQNGCVEIMQYNGRSEFNESRLWLL